MILFEFVVKNSEESRELSTLEPLYSKEEKMDLSAVSVMTQCLFCSREARSFICGYHLSTAFDSSPGMNPGHESRPSE